MKFRIIFLKKKYIYFFILLLIFISAVIIFIVSRSSSPSFNTISNNKKIKADFNGDGKDDILSIVRNENKYSMKVMIGDKSFNFQTDRNSPTIESYSPYWPIRVILMDVSRNKIPEIFVQGSIANKPVQRVFTFNNNKFDNIFSNYNNILGFIDCKNNKTPKVISGKLQGDSMTLSNYIFLNYKFKNYNYESDSTFMGKDTICAFIKLIQGLPQSESYKPKDIFYSSISSENMSLIGNMSGENNSYVFQDALFMETKCDTNGNTSELSWTLNFKAISNTDTNIVKNYTLNLVLIPDKSSEKKYHFKIASMYKAK
ncbi:FG-GAP repeat domain-containing protein [Clostridium coskatii]|uniref:FG-GAP repeat protein n=1 Tax=Clostridium coskatii TaxID=1705578 RepID=A0A166SQT6_9CLOT|nr:VCBS repeat-containing protein [Clostridium coskatii]OAA92663.1 hypothetical protein WX73_00755 [Clostridium coskatii]OBR94589.1 hypothetical protein CLCOS_18280 [Clostridium coskatii]